MNSKAAKRGKASFWVLVRVFYRLIVSAGRPEVTISVRPVLGYARYGITPFLLR